MLSRMLGCCDQPSHRDATNADLTAIEAAIIRSKAEEELVDMRRKRMLPRLDILEGNDLYRRRKSGGGFQSEPVSALEVFRALAEKDDLNTTMMSNSTMASIRDDASNNTSTPRTTGGSGESLGLDESEVPKRRRRWRFF